MRPVSLINLGGLPIKCARRFSPSPPEKGASIMNLNQSSHRFEDASFNMAGDVNQPTNRIVGSQSIANQSSHQFASAPFNFLQFPSICFDFLPSYLSSEPRWAQNPRAAVGCQNRPSQPAEFSMATILGRPAPHIAGGPWTRLERDLVAPRRRRRSPGVAAAPRPPPPLIPGDPRRRPRTSSPPPPGPRVTSPSTSPPPPTPPLSPGGGNTDPSDNTTYVYMGQILL